MAITWRNINTPNFNSSNNLAVSAGDTITRGVDKIVGVAEQLGEQQVKDNTADILSRINRADGEVLSATDVTAFSEQYGGQIDAQAITDGVQARTEELRKIARQDASDERAQEEFGLNKQRTKANIASLKHNNKLDAKRFDWELKDRQTKERVNTALASVDVFNYNSAEDAANATIKALSGFDELSHAAKQAQVESVKSTWNANVGTTPEQQQAILAHDAKAKSLIDTNKKNARQELDNQARELGYKVETLKLAQGESMEYSDIIKDLQKHIADSGAPWKENTIYPMLQYFSKQVGRQMNRNELEYFTPLGFSEGLFIFTDDGLNLDLAKKDIDQYAKNIANGAAATWYNNAINQIALAEAESLSNWGKENKLLRTQGIQNRQARYNDSIFVEPLDETPVDYGESIANDLKDLNWISGKAPSPALIETPDQISRRRSTYYY